MTNTEKIGRGSMMVLKLLLQFKSSIQARVTHCSPGIVTNGSCPSARRRRRLFRDESVYLDEGDQRQIGESSRILSLFL